ncbi:uncharacterized protein TrAtP1_002127 [Trichoderma atroviride]|uniref:uncharacterized protein n=1 Tax=Hypocrea atroviridis TaxID=63577 RepID=UPI003321EE93|nr:hypothetical protein TrAtP1_002127 [Trichoderma atroviride]
MFEILRLDGAVAAQRRAALLLQHHGFSDTFTASLHSPGDFDSVSCTLKPHAMALGRILRPALIHTPLERRVESMSLTIFDNLDAQSSRLDLPPHRTPHWYHVCAL